MDSSRAFSSSMRPAAVVDQRRQAAADAQVDARPLVGGVLGPHVVALLVGDHLERQLVVVAQEERPLAVVGDGRRALHDLDDRGAVLLAQRDPDARHEGEVEGHVALVAVTEVGPHVGRPLVGLGQQHPVAVALVERGPQPLQHRVRLRQVLAVGAVPLDQVRHRVQPQPVDAQVQPEAHHPQDGAHHRRVVVVQIGLVAEEPMPVVLLRGLVPGPVAGLGVGEDDPRLGVALRVVRTTRTSRASGGRARCATRRTTGAGRWCG